MPANPATWLNEFTVNLTTSGTQTNPRITQLANGNILVVWDSTDDSGVGAPAGIDVIGQLFNPLGERIGTEFLVNSGFEANAESNADVAALASGGFVAVFQDFAGVSGIDGIRSIRLVEYDANGLNPVSHTIALDTTPNADETFLNPRVAVSGASSVLVVYEVAEVGPDSRIEARIYDPTTGTVGAAISVLNANGSNATPDVAVLANGNYVIAAASVTSLGDQVISYRILSPSGSNVLGATIVADTSGDGQLDNMPSVTGLSGGGFVISWTNTVNVDVEFGIIFYQIQARVYNAAGTALGNQINVSPVLQSMSGIGESSVVALGDGGFIVIYDDTLNNELFAARYDASGAEIGVAAVASGGAALGQIDAELLDDGRIAISFTNAAGEIAMEIIDTRDAANGTGVYTPQGWQIGTIGDDTIISDGNVFHVAGWDGNDTITTGGFAASYFGGNGDDTVVVTSLIDNDFHDGGAGAQDVIDWSGSGQSGGTFNLVAGTAIDASDPGNVLSEVMTGFENLVGTAGNDVIVGTGDANSLDGGDGDDTITGGNGVDQLHGGEGNDTFLTEGDGVSDESFGGAGNDRFVLNNPNYAGHFDGGGDLGDIIDASLVTDFALTIDLGGEFYIDSGTTFTLLNVEHATGGQQADTITGDSGANILDGQNSADTLTGGGGADTLIGGAGDDVFAYASAADLAAGEVISGGAGTGDAIGLFSGASYNLALAAISGVEQLRFNGTGGTASLSGGQIGAGKIISVFGDGGVNTLNVSGAAVNLSGVAFNGWTAGTDVININGTAGADNLTGSSQNDTLVGFAGIDTMAGGAGDDRYFVDNASDAVSELAGAGTGFDSIFATVNYTIALNVERLFLQGTAISATGRDGQNEYLYGNALNNILDGKTGTDNMNGGLGNDSYYVNTSGDVINETIGGGTLDTIFAQTSYTNAANVERLFLLNGGNYNANGRNAQNDFLAGNDGANLINGLSGNDTIRGGLGNDTLTGGAGLDIFQFLTAPNSAANRDIITDFNIADDTIQMDNAIYTLIGANGALNANLFKNLLTAQDADDRILYDQANGNLFFDTNGLTAGGVIHFAEVTNGLALTAADFVVV